MEILLLIVGLVAGFVIALLYVYPIVKAHYEARLQEVARRAREQAGKEALQRSSAVIKGQIGERFAPFVPEFGYQPADARFLGNPVDYVVFDGLTDGRVREIAFVEVKTGSASLTPWQRQVQEAVNGGRVRWKLLHLND